MRGRFGFGPSGPASRSRRRGGDAVGISWSSAAVLDAVHVVVSPGVVLSAFVGAAVIASRDVAPGRLGGGLEVALPDGGRTHDGNIRALARDVFSDHVLAFELTSVLLVIAVVATVMLARKPRKGETLLDANGGAA